MKTKPISRQISPEELEASRLLDYLTTSVIDLEPEDRSKGYSANFRPSGSKPLEFGDMGPSTILDAVNRDLPEDWKKQISEISFKK